MRRNPCEGVFPDVRVFVVLAGDTVFAAAEAGGNAWWLLFGYDRSACYYDAVFARGAGVFLMVAVGFFRVRCRLFAYCLAGRGRSSATTSASAGAWCCPRPTAWTSKLGRGERRSRLPCSGARHSPMRYSTSRFEVSCDA